MGCQARRHAQPHLVSARQKGPGPRLICLPHPAVLAASGLAGFPEVRQLARDCATLADIVVALCRGQLPEQALAAAW